MNQILVNILAYGYIYIVGFIFLTMFIQLFSFYLAGKITGSINDEFMSAFTLLGAMFVLGMGSTLANAILSIFLPGLLGSLGLILSVFAAFIIFLWVAIYLVMRIYDLSALKAFLHLILSLIFTAVITGLLVYAGIKFLPKAVQNSATMGSDISSETNALGAVTEEPAAVEPPTTETPPATTGNFVDPATAGLPGTEPAPEPATVPEPDLVPEQFVPPVGSGPKLPGAPVPPPAE